MKRFNVTGTCFPHMHYMANTSEKIEQIVKMIDLGDYFTINRARQYGKTTTMRLLGNRLASDYLVIHISFQGIDIFSSQADFVQGFYRMIERSLKLQNVENEILDAWSSDRTEIDFLELDDKITLLCQHSNKKIVLLIDEVDKSSDSQVFLSFLGLLREKYLNRDVIPTFHSVILAGVYDIKNLKLKLRSDEERKFNSPWNIAAKFDVDLSLSVTEIKSMLVEYEADHTIGIDVAQIADSIHEYTSGYPFLVSRICLEIHDNTDLDWSYEGIVKAVKAILSEKNTLFDDIGKNLENNKKLYAFMYALLIQGKEYTYTVNNPEIETALMYGFIRVVDNRLFIHNKIFEVLITNYFISKQETDTANKALLFKEEVTANGQFNMELCFTKFSEYYQSAYNDKEIKFLEDNCKFIFLIYLQALINGIGFYALESQLSDRRRMDIVVYYGGKRYIIELKLWYGEREHERAYHQLLGYMNAQGEKEGYLLTFDFRQQKEPRAEWIELEGKKIYDCVV